MTKPTTPKRKACAIKSSQNRLYRMCIKNVMKNFKKFSVKQKDSVIDFDTLTDLTATAYPESLPKDNIEAAIYLMQKN